MFTRIKTPEEIESMRTSGQMLATILKRIKESAATGITGKDISALAAKELKALGGKPSFLGYGGFPDVICISRNDEIVHGIPNAQAFQEGDIVSFDFGVTYKGMITDSAFTMIIGHVKADKDVERLLKATERSLYDGIEQLKDGVRVGDIAATIQKTLDNAGLGIVRELVGHGVGHQVHEDPNIPNYGVRSTGPMLKKGMTIAIEPMATLGSHKIKFDPDGWSVRTADGSLSAHFEHTILITEGNYEILTAW
jgi:methionyl aminopeptidase